MPLLYHIYTDRQTIFKSTLFSLSNQIAVMMAAPPIRSETPGGDLMKEATCWSVSAWATGRENGPVNLLVSHSDS